MKKILSTLVCVLLGINASWAATFTISPQAQLREPNTGQVRAVSITAVTSGGTETPWGTSSVGNFSYSHTSLDEGRWWTTYFCSFVIRYEAKAAQGYYFAEWDEKDWRGRYQQKTTERLYQFSQNVDDGGPLNNLDQSATAYYAYFKPIITSGPTHNSVTIRKNSASCGTATASITVDKTKSFDISYGGVDLGLIATVSGLSGNASNGETGTITITAANATDNTNVGTGYVILTPRNPDLTIEAYNAAPCTITVVVEKTPVITFKPAANGSYKCTPAEGNEFTVTTSDVIYEPLNNAQSQITLTAQPAEGYYFYRWVKNDATIGTVNAEPFTTPTGQQFTFNEDGTVVTAEFKPDFQTYFHGPKVGYYSTSAKNGIISVSTSGVKYTGDITKTSLNVGEDGPIDLNANVYRMTNTHSYSITYTATNTEFATFVKWVDIDGNQLSTNNEYIYTANTATDKPEDAQIPPMVYAVFESFYYQPQITTMEKDGSDGLVLVTRSSDYPAITAEWKLSGNAETVYNADVIQVATGNNASAQVVVHYHAMNGASTSFQGWAPEENENAISLTGSTTKTWAKTCTVSSKDKQNPTLLPVWAFFLKETKFYYKRAQVGVGEQSENGKVYVDKNASASPDWNTISENTQSTSNEADDADGKDDGIFTLQDNPSFSYTYFAQPSDPSKVAFMGWSSSPDVYNEVSSANPYTTTYTASDNENMPEEPSTLFAFFRSFYYAVPYANALGGGRVYVSDEVVESEAITGWANNFEDNTTLHQVPWLSQGFAAYDFYFYAKEEDGAHFEGWTTSPDSKVVISSENPYRRNSQTSSQDKINPHRSAPLYAIFQSCLEIKQQDRMICYLDDQDKGYINDARIIINLSEAEKLEATLDNTTDFKLTNKSGTLSTSAETSTFTLDATKGLLQLHLSYTGELNKSAIGKFAKITLVGKSGSNKIVERTITITIEEAPIITFLPTDGKGSYTISLTDGSGITHSMSQTASTAIQVPVTNETQANIQMSIKDNESDKYLFFGWKKIERGIESYISYDKTCAYTFNAAATVYPEFIPDNLGTFIIQGDDSGVVYHDLQKALDDAETYVSTKGSAQIVVFDNKFGNVTPQEQITGLLAKGNYTIPQNVTLLIPGEEKYNSILGNPSSLHKEVDSQTAIQPSAFRKLIIEAGTTIDVKGNICLYTPQICSRGADTYMARPSTFGQLELGENCKINIHSNAGLYAFGYITGAKSSQVRAMSGALVYELFQFTDYRGGSGTGNLYVALREDYKIFPINQYYIQNIEVPLALESGATELLSSAVTMGGQVTTLELPFIVASSKSGSGFFKLGQNALFTKYYDPTTDRMKFQVENGDCTIDYVEMNMGRVAIIDVNIDSREYVLPINHNMDLSLINTHLVCPNDMAFLAGSTVYVDENSTVNVNSKVYVYDRDQNDYPDDKTLGFLGSTHQKLMPITYTPTHPTGTSAIRKPENLQDAKWIVNGQINVSGGIYTTEGKAAITSTKNGKIIFNKTNGNSNTYQAYYIGFSSTNDLGQVAELFQKGKVNKLITYPVHSASLKNAAPDSWTESEQGTYTYNYVLGIWEKEHTTAAKWEADEIKITQPQTSQTIIGKWYKEGLSSLSGYTISTTSTAYSLGSIEYNDGAINIPITYTAQNKAGKHVGEILINDGTSTYTLLVTAIEDYTPIFNVTNPYETSAVVGSYSYKTPFVSAVSNNITELVTNNNLVWTSQITGVGKNQFSFAFGEGAAKLTSSTLTFTPTSIGKKSATLTISATYTDANNVAHTTTVDIPLIGNANALNENTLAFADLSTIYVGQTNSTKLFTGTGSSGDIFITITDEVNVAASGDKLTVEVNDFCIEGSGESMTINPKKTGTYTIKAVQFPSATVDGTTITKTVTIHPRVKWNWENMYFGGKYDNPITFMDGTNPEYTLVEETDAQNVVNYNSDTKTATISAWETGEAEATFTFKQGSTTLTFTSHIHRDPRRLRVDVNDLRTYKAVNADTVGVQFDNLDKTIIFNSPSGKTSQWTMYFEGVPDELYFTPTQAQNAWQIEESPNGTNWITTYTWASIATNTPFSHSLFPTTRYLRITYGGAGVESQAILANFYVTALTSVKADLNKVYIPTVPLNAFTEKDVVFTYASLTSGLTLSTSNSELFKLSATSLPATSETAPYQVQQVTLKSTATTETTEFIYVKDGDKTLLEIPIYVYQYPQDLPILMASDPLERYYFVTEETYRTTWEEKTRTIVMDNAVSNASPFVTFHFSDSPTPGLISFNHTAGCKGTWLIEERASDDEAWEKHYMTPNNTNAISQQLSDESRYVRVTYISAYAEVIKVTNLAIVPTANIKVTPAEKTVMKGNAETILVRANNLADLEITCTSSNFTWEPTDVNTWVGSGTKENNLTINYNGTAAVEYATLYFISTVGSEKIVLATVELTGILGALTTGNTGIYTGVHDGINGTIINDAAKYLLKGDFVGFEFTPVNISDAFVPSTSTPLFDYLFIFGETTTMDGTTTITTPDNSAGSNAKTPCYIYKKGSAGYDFYKVIDNANASTKVTHELDILQLKKSDAENLKVYITGFCPYASTGYTKNDEGVFFFQGGANDKVDIYLQDCYLYSRYKTWDGHSFIDRSNGESFSEEYVRGSGGVLVFECTKENDKTTPFNVTIHTKGHNVLKSHYGCFYESIVGRAYQVSSPVQVHLANENFETTSYTTISFDDLWPINADHTELARTNGFLSLQKQVNNAPSIDLGNALTTVNFNGGRIELQNAQIVSTNYKTTMAISHRSGEFGGFKLSVGMGSDAAGGTVNFNDGTTTVKEMWVNPDYVNYYLIDKDGDDYITNSKGEYRTSCLRCPTNTFVKGGSHCMMRACSNPTSKGGAPTDGNGNPLGLYKYPYTDANNITHKGGWTLIENSNGLVSVPQENLPNSNYGVKSVTPNTNNSATLVDDYLNFWVTKDYDPSVKPEVDQKLSFWKTCMPYIKAEYAGYERAVGGPTIIERNATNQTELISNFLYCQIDENISDVISDNYYAPVKNPTPSGGYESIKPTVVGEEYQNYVETYDMTDPAQPNPTGDDFEVAGKIYYITTIPSADVWMTFTAPFDVEKVYVVEAFEESKLENYSNDREEILKFQAIHNANFAAFFGVAMALGTDKSFDDIYEDYKGWARLQDNGELKRGLKELIHYYKDDDTPANWDVADYYLYQHGGTNWKLDDENSEEYDVFKTDWDLVKKQDGKLMQKHKTYSMFFPYCMGCFKKDSEDNFYRDFWDYWSGKFLVFESTLATESAPHIVTGSKFIGSTTQFPEEPSDFEKYNWPFYEDNFVDDLDLGVYINMPKMPEDESLLMTGNPTFSLFGTKLMSVYPYAPNPMQESFYANVEYAGDGVLSKKLATIQPTESFLLGAELQPASMIPAKISRNGEVIYAYYKPGDGTTTDTKTPTVGGGNQLFITAIDGGINISVAAPQMVCVVNATGHVLYSGYVTDNVNVSLPINGIYVVKGENEVQKIFF